MRTPAPHQERALSALARWWKSTAEKNQHGFLVMPTGSGKTYTAVQFAVREVLRKRNRVLWIAHNDYLISQAEEEFAKAIAEVGMSADIALARVRGDGRGADANITLASIQMLDRGDALSRIFDEDCVHVAIFDEFHHMAADSWKKVAHKIKRRKVRLLGLSATPFRTRAEDHDVLRSLFPRRIFGVGMTELIRAKFLAQPKIIRIRNASQLRIHLDDEELRQYARFHRLPESVLARVAMQAGRDEMIVQQYLRHRGEYRKTIVFCCGVDHARCLARAFEERGVQAGSITGSAKDEANRAKLAEFRDGTLEVLTSVLLLTEGVDVPKCRTAFLARPTESPILLQQMIGRAMRGLENRECNVVDFVDNFERGLDFSASATAYLRDFEPAVRRLLTRRSRPEDLGVNLALMLRVREFINRRMAESSARVDPAAIWEEEVMGWIECWDGEFQRALLVPGGDEGRALLDAWNEVSDAASGGDRPPTEQEALEMARAVYHDRNLLHEHVPEEDFVCIAAQARCPRELGSIRFVERNVVETSPVARRAALAAVESVQRDMAAEPGLQNDLAQVVEAMRAAFDGAAEADSTTATLGSVRPPDDASDRRVRPGVEVEGIYCVKCRRINPPSFNYCGGCGSGFALSTSSGRDAARSVCPQCEHANPSGNLYCASCGFKLER